nr:E3 SUMO-protein ligase SIZ1-like isoform X1 [Tanacetum cinerariifolium]
MKGILVFSFSVTTPLGIAFGILPSNGYQENNMTALVVVGVLNAVSAGLLNYMALVDLLAANFLGKRLKDDMRGMSIKDVCHKQSPRACDYSQPQLENTHRLLQISLVTITYLDAKQELMALQEFLEFVKTVDKVFHPGLKFPVRFSREDQTEIEVKPDGYWRVKPNGCWRVKPDGDYWKSLGDLGQWHLPDGTLCVPTKLESRPNPKALNQVKAEGASEGHTTSLNLGMKKNKNGFWEVRKPDNINSMSAGSKLPEFFMNNGHKAIPKSSSATGSGRDGEDISVNQECGRHFDYSTPNGAELHSLSLNHGFTDQNFVAGNTTKETTKGFAIGSAALASFLLFSVYMNEGLGITDGTKKLESKLDLLRSLDLVKKFSMQLNVICKDKDEDEVWFSGLKALISHGHQRKWRTDMVSHLKLIVLGPIRVDTLHCTYHLVLAITHRRYNNNFNLKELQNVEQQLETALKRIRTRKGLECYLSLEPYKATLEANSKHR